MEGQDRFIMRELDDAEVGLGEDCEEVLADVGNNADLYGQLWRVKTGLLCVSRIIQMWIGEKIARKI